MDLKQFWQYEAGKLLSELGSSEKGLSDNEAQKRLQESKAGEKHIPEWWNIAKLLLRQFKSPLVLLLVAAVIISAILGETSDAFIILFILLSSGILSFFQEYHASKAVAALINIIKTKIDIIRDGKELQVDSADIVPGDILHLNAGDIIAADSLLIKSKDLQVNEASLTGESAPVNKKTGIVNADASLNSRDNSVFEGTNVVSGEGLAVVVLTGKDTVLGNISKSIEKEEEETAFEKGIRKFGMLLMKMTIVMAVVICAINIIAGKPFIDSLLFSLALAVGMAPELLPAIMTIAMSKGAKRMSTKKVIVKKLSAIQNLGEIDLLCSDKTGTITEGVLTVDQVVDIEGNKSDQVLLYAYLNAALESAYNNPIDEAIAGIKGVDIDGYEKKDEMPFDFNRKRLTVLVSSKDKTLIISKGAVKNLLDVCSQAMTANGQVQAIDTFKERISKAFEDYSGRGFRVIGIAYKESDAQKLQESDEQGLIFAGFVLLADPPKKGIKESLDKLHKNKIALKIITGDNKFAAMHLAEVIGLKDASIKTAAELGNPGEEEFQKIVSNTTIFAETEPQHKEHIINALKKAGFTVGYMGDGINDVPALHAADVGISANNAVDVAREAASVVLLEKNLDVLNDGIIEGRKTFVNTFKYIYISTSATLGNMFSLAIASVVLPFLPMLPGQILMTNFLTDFPFISAASDNVDKDVLTTPKKWDLGRIKQFMLIFGLHSSVFDMLTFFILFKVIHTSTEVFRTGWFIESVATELLILFIIRTHRSFIKSKPTKALVLLGCISLAVTILLPYSPVAGVLSLSPLPWRIWAIIGGILLGYIVSADILKIYFFKKHRNAA